MRLSLFSLQRNALSLAGFERRVATFNDDPGNPRSNKEHYIGENGFIETAREYWTDSTGAAPVTEKAGQDNSIGSLRAFVQRIAGGRPGNVGVRAAESTLTSILGRMAIDRKREVTWDEMMRNG